MKAVSLYIEVIIWIYYLLEFQRGRIFTERPFSSFDIAFSSSLLYFYFLLKQTCHLKQKPSALFKHNPSYADGGEAAENSLRKVH